MNTALATPPILFSEQEIMKHTRLEPMEFRRYHPDDFGVPGHWLMTKQGGIVYTEKGVEGLADALEAAGYAVAAVCLRVELRQRREAPSRSLIPARPKARIEHPAWMDRADLA